MEAEDITHEIATNLIKKQMKNKASENDKIMLDRYNFKKDWNVKNLTGDFIDEFYGKSYIIKNLRLLTGKITKSDPILEIDDNKYVDHDISNELDKIQYIEKMITLFGFDNINDKKEIDQTQFKKSIEEIRKMFMDDNMTSTLLFGLERNRLETVTEKGYLKFINGLFKNYGFKMKSREIRTQKQVNKKRTQIRTYMYSIRFIKNINNYL